MIKKTALYILLISSFHLAYGQDNPVSDATYHFTLDHHKFNGPGGDTLMTYIGYAQFFMIGEEPRIWKQLLG